MNFYFIYCLHLLLFFSCFWLVKMDYKKECKPPPHSKPALKPPPRKLQQFFQMIVGFLLSIFMMFVSFIFMMFVSFIFMMYSKISCVFNIGVHIHCAKNREIAPLKFYAKQAKKYFYCYPIDSWGFWLTAGCLGLIGHF